MDELEIYKFISDGINLLLFLFQGYLLQHFNESFLEHRLKSKQWNRVFVMVLFLLLRSVSWIWRPEDPTVKAVVYLVWLFALTALLVLGFYRSSYGIASFLIVTFVAVSECSVMFAYTLLHVSLKLLGLWLWFFEHGYFLFEEFLVAVEVTGTVVTALYSVIIAGLMYVFLRKVICTFRERDRKLHRTERWFLLTPGITGLLICLLLRIIIFTVESSALELFYDNYPLLVLVVPVIMLLCLMSICNRVKLFQNMTRLNRERNSRVILEKQIGSMQEHIAEIERLYSGIRNIKHDMRNTLSIVMCLASENREAEKGELDAYLTELNRTLDKLELHYRTGNAVVDTLLNMKYHELLVTMPECELDAEQLIFPAGLVIQSYDFGVILGNALDNAMEACKKLYEQDSGEKLFIRLASFRRGNQFFIEVVNSFDGRIFRGKEREFPETCKADKKLHGMGLYHIKSTAEKYYGAVEWSADSKMFTLTVMLQNQISHENEEK